MLYLAYWGGLAQSPVSLCAVVIKLTGNRLRSAGLNALPLTIANIATMLSAHQ
jgi:hypothetical protein